MNILANDGLADAGVKILEHAGFNVVTDKVAQEDLIKEINDKNYVALLVRSATTVRKDLIEACPGLRLIGRGGVGMDNIDVDYAKAMSMYVVNTPQASSQSVAELVIGHMFSISRGLYDAGLHMPQTGINEFNVLKKKYSSGRELRGKYIGIIGFGRIGQSTAKYALGCGMMVLAYDLLIDKITLHVPINNTLVLVEIPTVSLDELLSRADYISIHVPKQANGKAVIGTDEIEKMKNGVYIINAARGGVVDEDALVKGLDSGKIAGAALDVFENEPTPREDLLKHPKIASTPHIGAATVEAQNRVATELARQIIDVLK